ncbi:MAG: type II toxin-antitoxin system Phd/YefM family antitoxin [Candidatus Omnitrophica bacterium]|nr:type II toxin-antitoxin system Phd/YefM family antitoxin [Candidatus Omnitrophota bacterium]
MANIVDLRYKMKDVLKALARKERVEIIYSGKPRGVITPVHEHNKKSVMDHPFFGSMATDKRPVSKIMDELRGGRYRAV